MDRRWIKVDKNKCTGCRMCELACAFKHGINEVNPLISRIIIEKDEIKGTDIPKVCRQCKPGFCAKACPVNAITFHENLGVWVIDESLCTGCNKCVEACPFKVMYMDFDRNIAIKCDLCKGGEPACVAICPTGAIEL